jgi:hypothetical protein
MKRVALLVQVAIKKMKSKFYSWEECMQLREIKVRCDRWMGRKVDD